jgi:hypothetical protein
MELLLPMATKKLDLSFNIEPDVPDCTFWGLSLVFLVYACL